MEIRTAAPRIPDHEVLRCIGKGSYGEVWLARAVTGTLRAVKVVRREDFELDRTFEREFEGIMKFEPISRDHPGLVHVLHVGRNDEEKFYYYVMELADDRERGSRVDAADYEARTMGTDKTTKNRLPVTEVVEHGAQLAEGLAHLHECGLTHRDIKPSNIIFVNGKAKLADIGLVAAAGQMTFVGTEGFVPPEGPGTKLADIYSLGMVLYEMSTGKDRLQFPELPDDLGEARTRPQWQALNEIILRACASQPKKRFPTAREMALALRAASQKKLIRGSWFSRLVNFPLITAAIGFVIVTWRHHGAMPWPPGRFVDAATGISPPPPLVMGKVRLESNPPSADIYFRGNKIGRTPWICEVPPGTAQFLLKRQQFRDEFVTVTGIEPEKLSEPPVILMLPSPPTPGLEWRNSLDMPFDPLPDGSHVSRRAVSESQFSKIQRQEKGGVEREVTSDGGEIYMIQVPHAEALRFCAQLTAWETQIKYLMDDLYYRPEVYQAKDVTKEKPGLEFFRLAVEKYGRLTINSTPPGAAIFEGDKTEPLGYTPKTIERQLPGDLDITLSLPGYTDFKITDKLRPGKELTLDPVMTKSSMAVFGARWRNSLGQVFQTLGPSGPELLVAERETQVKDYAIFAKEKDRKVQGNDMKQTGNHPVVNVTREDAREFCRWLTARERKSGYLNESMEYRLPKDTEWSLAADSANMAEDQVTPAQRNMAIQSVYPWNRRYFPPMMASPQGNSKTSANLGDLSALKAGVLHLKPEEVKALEELHYTDGSVYTAPVGMYAPGAFGLCDMSGNVWEFVDDDYGGKAGNSGPEPAGTPDQSHYAVLRGGAWDTSAADEVKLAIHYRRAIPPDKFDSTSGFRIVVAPLPGEESDSQPSQPSPSSSYPLPPFTPPFTQPPGFLLPGNNVPPAQTPANPPAGSGARPPRELPHNPAPNPSPNPATPMPSGSTLSPMPPVISPSTEPPP